MQIKTKIALQFSIIVATILALFSLSIYYLSENYRKQEFYKSLKDRALTTARLLINEKEIDKKLLKIIDKNTLSTLYAVEVLVFNDSNAVSYSNYEADTIFYSPELLERIRNERYVESNFQEKQVVGTVYEDEAKKSYVVLAQSIDIYGKEKLRNIKNTLLTGFLSAILLTVLFGFIFAGQSLKPIADINQEISKINVYNLTKKIKTGNNKDELAQLAINFNEMLQRLEKSFELQKSFVSNASHELRTPLAAIKSEIQIALEKDRSSEEYKEILNTLLIDNQRLIKLINGLLQLAKSEDTKEQIIKLPVRIDELLFEIQEQLTHLHPSYSIQIDFDEITEDESAVTVLGSKQLLSTLYTNLIENACKYSKNQTAQVFIQFDNENSVVRIKDQGIGISSEEIKKIFEPFYRTNQASTYKGYGIGLSICRKIAEMHTGKIDVKSVLNKGSEFTVSLPRS